MRRQTRPPRRGGNLADRDIPQLLFLWPHRREVYGSVGWHGVPHEYIVFEHSGHGLQNDNAQYALYMEKVEEYLERYMG